MDIGDWLYPSYLLSQNICTEAQSRTVHRLNIKTRIHEVLKTTSKHKTQVGKAQRQNASTTSRSLGLMDLERLCVQLLTQAPVPLKLLLWPGCFCCSPTQFIGWNPNLKCYGIRKWDFGGGGNLVMRVEPSWVTSMLLYIRKRPGGFLPLFPSGEETRRSRLCAVRWELSSEPDRAGTLTLYLQPPELWEYISVVWAALSVEMSLSSGLKHGHLVVQIFLDSCTKPRHMVDTLISMCILFKNIPCLKSTE